MLCRRTPIGFDGIGIILEQVHNGGRHGNAD